MINKQQIMGFDSGHVCPVDAQHVLMPEVREAFLAMQSDAHEQGLDLQICSSFRSFEKQLSIWNRKWLGELPLFSLDGDLLELDTLSDIDKIHAIMLWSALPGASRHHWGTDFDFYDKTRVEASGHPFKLVTDEYETDGPCAALATWVHANAARFGFYLPYANYVGGVAREPWHLSYKKTAEHIQQHFDLSLLTTLLTESNIQGKDAVLAILPELVERYTYNRGCAL
ncbi:M15 family metallopeptidase [Glaciecola siphonariae]|uniref:M15 family metallopeptidase n=1 Tax=Glaciecola siphonariae TaxID=521012 RepID=A0ABV9LTR9_9ALTE